MSMVAWPGDAGRPSLGRFAPLLIGLMLPWWGYAQATQLRLQVAAGDRNAPIEGAEVRATVDDRIYALRTGPDGAAEIPLPADGLRTSLHATVEAAGYVPVVLNWRVDAVPASYVLRLVPGSVIGGRVLYMDGNPVHGAEVQLFVPGDPSAVEQPALTDYVAHTDEEGRWRCDVAPPGLDRVRLQVRAPGQSQVLSVTFSDQGKHLVSELRSREADVSVERRYVLRGSVEGPDGAPVGRARVLGWSVEEGSRAYSETRTDAGGDFALTDMKLGDAQVLVESDLFAPELVQAVVTPEGTAEGVPEQGLMITLDPGAPLHGRVVDDAGSPVEYAYVSVERWGAVSRIGWRTRTGPDGVFEWANAPEGEVVLRVTARDHVEREAVALRAGPDQHEVVLTRVLSLTVSGEVLDADTGESAGWFTVTPGIPGAESGEANWIEELAVEDIGNFRIQLDASAPVYVLRIEAEGYAPVTSPPFEVRQREVRFDVQVRRTAAPD